MWTAPSLQGVFQCFDQIACVHMSGLFVRSHMNAGHMLLAHSLQGVFQCFDQIACVHMSGLFVRSHMNAGQDGFRDNSSKQNGDLIEGHWKMRSFSRRGSADHTICLLSCKFRPQLSTVAVELLPCLADL